LPLLAPSFSHHIPVKTKETKGIRRQEMPNHKLGGVLWDKGIKPNSTRAIPFSSSPPF